MRIDLINLAIFLIVTLILPYVFPFSENAEGPATAFSFCLGLLTVYLFPVIQDSRERQRGGRMSKNLYDVISAIEALLKRDMMLTLQHQYSQGGETKWADPPEWQDAEDSIETLKEILGVKTVGSLRVIEQMETFLRGSIPTNNTAQIKGEQNESRTLE